MNPGKFWVWARPGVEIGETVGYSGFKEALQTSIDQAARQAETTIPELDGAGFGICGFDWPSQYPVQSEIIQSLGLACPFELMNDTLIGLLGRRRTGLGGSHCGGYRL